MIFEKSTHTSIKEQFKYKSILNRKSNRNTRHNTNYNDR